MFKELGKDMDVAEKKRQEIIALGKDLHEKAENLKAQKSVNFPEEEKKIFKSDIKKPAVKPYEAEKRYKPLVPDPALKKF